MNRTRARLAILAAVPVLAVGGATAASARPAIPGTAATVLYSISTNQRTNTITVVNGNGNRVRARSVCLSGTYYGGWVISGVTAVTCPTLIASAGFQYNRNNPVTVTCWVPGDPKHGGC